MKSFPYKYIVEDYNYFSGDKIRIRREEYIGIRNAMNRAHTLAANGKSVSVMDGSYTVARFIQDADTKFIWYPVNKPLRGIPILSKVVEVLKQHYN